MSSMDTFLKTNLPLCNKNTPITITYGVYIHPASDMFDTRISKNKAQDFIDIINTFKGSNFVKEQYFVVDYIHNNEILSIETCKNISSHSYSIVSEEEYYQHSNLLFQKFNIKKDDFIPHSGKYELCIKYNKLILFIHQSFVIELKHFTDDNYYTLSIVVKKPTTYDTIMPLLNKLL